MRWPSETQFKALAARVDAQATGSVARLRASGPDVAQQITVAPQTRSVWHLRLRPNNLTADQSLSEIRVQVPAGATELPANLQIILGNGAAPVVPLVGEARFVDVDGARWLSLPVRVRLSVSAFLPLHLNFGEAYPLVVSEDPADQNPDLLTEATATETGNVIGVLVGARLGMAGPRTVVDALSPDAWPFVDSPTPAAQFPDPGLEVVLGSSPYLRLRLGGQEYALPFTPQG